MCVARSSTSCATGERLPLAFGGEEGGDLGAQGGLVELGDAGHRQLGPDLDALGVLVLGDAQGGQVDAQRGHVNGGGAVGRDDERAAALAEQGVGHGYHGDPLDGWVPHQQLFDLGGVDLLAAPGDQVLDPVGQRVVTVLQLDHDVAGAVETVGGEYLGVPLGRPVVAADRVGAAAAQLPRLTRGYRVLSTGR